MNNQTFNQFRQLIPDEICVSCIDQKTSMELESNDQFYFMSIYAEVSNPHWITSDDLQENNQVVEAWALQTAYMGDEEVKFSEDQLFTLENILKSRVIVGL